MIKEKGKRMSFNSMKLQELRDVAENFGVDLHGVKAKKDLIELLDEEGVTFDLYQKFFAAEKDAPENHLDNFNVQNQQLNLPSPDQQTVLVKMDRVNNLYETCGFTFTREHPYVAMSGWQAQGIFDVETGFRLATPKEIQEYYS